MEINFKFSMRGKNPIYILFIVEKPIIITYNFSIKTLNDHNINNPSNV